MGLIWRQRLPVADIVPDWGPPLAEYTGLRAGVVYEPVGKHTEKQQWGAPQKLFRADTAVVVAIQGPMPATTSNLPFSANNSSLFTGGSGGGAFSEECS
ncbi:MAG: hypothetical protein ACRD72_22335 [Candidatus Angelobacter sp.]